MKLTLDEFSIALLMGLPSWTGLLFGVIILQGLSCNIEGVCIQNVGFIFPNFEISSRSKYPYKNILIYPEYHPYYNSYLLAKSFVFYLSHVS